MDDVPDIRRLVTYSALAAWSMGLDCIVYDAGQLRRHFFISRLEDTRVERILKVARPVFPYATKLWSDPDTHSQVTIFLSRSELPSAVFKGRMSNGRRIELLNLTIPTGRVELPDSYELMGVLEGLAAGRALLGPPRP